MKETRGEKDPSAPDLKTPGVSVEETRFKAAIDRPKCLKGSNAPAQVQQYTSARINE